MMYNHCAFCFNFAVEEMTNQAQMTFWQNSSLSDTAGQERHYPDGNAVLRKSANDRNVMRNIFGSDACRIHHIPHKNNYIPSSERQIATREQGNDAAKQLYSNRRVL